MKTEEIEVEVKQITVRITPEQHDWIKKLIDELEFSSFSDAVRKALKLLMKYYEKRKEEEIIL